MVSKEWDDETGDVQDLDLGLRAAFANTETGLEALRSRVIETLEETVGPCTRVALREAADEPAPVVSPLHGDSSSKNRLQARYQVLGEIARGGVGVVMKGRDVDLGRDVAIKLLRDDHRDNRALVHRFIEEAQIGGQLQHPGILPVYEMGLNDEAMPFFAMKLVRGQTLATLLNDRASVQEDRGRFLSIFEHVCQTVAYAHSKGVVHRDLKPSNIMVGPFGEVQVVDWGLAKVLARHSDKTGPSTAHHEENEDAVKTVRTEEPSTNSMAGSVMGTPCYMSKEQANGEIEQLDERSDVFSLGAILCEILSGKPPYVGSREEVMRDAREGRVAPALERLGASDADGELIEIARACMSAARDSRPRHANALAKKITEYIASLERKAHDAKIATARAQAKAEQERRSKRLTVGLVLSLLLATVLGGGGLVFLQQARNAQAQEQGNLVSASMERAAEALGRAIAAPAGEDEPWIEAHTAAEPVRQYLEEGRLHSSVRQRAEVFLAKLDAADRDRQFVNKIEEVVIVGATHEDLQSWLWMEKELRQAFVTFGIDVEDLSPREVAERIAESDLNKQLADALELWIGTRGHLLSLGHREYSISGIRQWTNALSRADPDPFTVGVRELVYSAFPTAEKVRALMQTVDLSTVRPITLSWLAGAAYRTKDYELSKEIFEIALGFYPTDFMLIFDYANIHTVANEWKEAVRYYERALAIRPDSGGIWRSLGVAYRHLGDMERSLDALDHSVEFQSDHGPTYVDLGVTLESMGLTDEALEAYENALEHHPDLEEAKERIAALKKTSSQQEE